MKLKSPDNVLGVKGCCQVRSNHERRGERNARRRRGFCDGCGGRDPLCESLQDRDENATEKIRWQRILKLKTEGLSVSARVGGSEHLTCPLPPTKWQACAFRGAEPSPKTSSQVVLRQLMFWVDKDFFGLSNFNQLA